MNNNKTFEELYSILRNESRYCTEDGTLIKTNIVSDALSLNSSLLKILLSNERMEKLFFTDIEQIKVFDKQKFQNFIMDKSVLSDQYTQYKNRVGLTIADRYTKENGDVLLAWPYKDCMLEGGQTKEDVKENRKEIFWNETLASDEIDRLKEPKAFSDFVMYDKDGKHKVDEIEENQNYIIKGNNLLVLYSLKKRFGGSVKMIYIDPPYYFKKLKDTDTFKYNSNFHLSTWLVFMKDRLKVAKEMLKPGGTIWIHVGEDGMHYLKVLADEIFGADHFVGTLPRRTRSAKDDVPFNFSQDFDWILLYTNVDENNKKTLGRKVERKYYETPDFPGRPWRTADLTSQQPANKRPNSFFTMINPKNGKEYPASEKRTWAVTYETFDDYYYNKHEIIFPGDYDFLNISGPVARKFKDDDDAKSERAKLSAIISDFQIKDFLGALLNGSKNKDGNNEIDELFGRDEFDYAKPENLVKAIMEVCTKEGDLVMDFFLGSGTTAAVAHKMNRRYIGIEQLDYIERLAVNRLQQVINGDDIGVSEDLDWKGGGSFVYCKLSVANQSFIDKITDASTSEELVEIWDEMQNTGFLSWRIDPEEINKTISSFMDLALDEKKEFLNTCLDKNMLYVPYSELDNKDFYISELDKRLTKEFYKKA